MKLSERGIALFLDCHVRLCRLARDLLPYGVTLRVAVTLLAEMPNDELISELGCDELAAFTGDRIRFVGTSPSLAAMTADIAARAASMGEFAMAPRTWQLFVAALSCMRAIEDERLLQTYKALGASKIGGTG